MAILALTNAYVTVNSVDLSDHLVKVTIDTKGEPLDATAMSSTGYRSRIGGLKDWSVTLEFEQDFASAKVDATIFPLLGSATQVEVKAVNAARTATNPGYIGSVLVTEYAPVGNGVGELATVSFTWPAAGALTRSTS